MSVETVVEDERWETADLAAIADRACDGVMSRLGLDPLLFEISLLGADDARIAALNADFRDKPTPTNVLSWPSEERASAAAGVAPDLPEPGTPDDPEALGDIALAYETCANEAQAGGIAFSAHTTHLIVHGILHLLGYDHEEDADAELMERLETEVLADLGVANPYS